jgi:molecular chaperone DnaK
VTRSTIDFGIDLGTTNSCIACARGTDFEIIRNNEGFETTPSAVWVDRKGRIHVGRRAKEQYEADVENAAIEFKLQMGKADERLFQRTGQKWKPEELSGEVLKSVLGDVRQRYGEEVRAAVITVPADFDLPQCDATRRAAGLAGLTTSPLLQEPVAAALAYGFQSNRDKVFWLVFDMGGGTFDAAVIQMREGLFRVVNHGGDRHLGGKLIDWAIVEQLLVPGLTREFPLEDFRRGNPRWRTAFAKLKLAAEQAKIRLSRDASTEVSLEFADLHGTPIHFEYDLQKAEVERLVEPFVLRALNICKRVLAEKRLGAADVEKVLLVGGPTLMPYLRQRLADPSEGLGIPLETHLDPMTVVAAGAAIYAGSQLLEGGPTPSAAAGQYVLQLEFQPVGADPEPLVGGKVASPGERSLAGFTIEFHDPTAQPPRRSGKLPLAAEGTFLTHLWATRGRTTTFHIELCDPAGRACPTTPSEFSYTLGNTPTDPTLIHSLGVAMVNNAMDTFIAKGTALPARKRIVHRTARTLRRGEAGALLRIPVVEGENRRRANRNRLIGMLEVTAGQLKRDLPLGSEIEITIKIDPSRQLSTHAFIPLLDEEFENVVTFHQVKPSVEQLREDLKREQERLADVRRKAQEMDAAQAGPVFQRIDKEQMVQDALAALGAADNDPDAADKCQHRLLDLKSAIDEAEDALEWPALLADAEAKLTELRQLIEEKSSRSEKMRAEVLERELRGIIAAGDADLLLSKTREVWVLSSHLLWERPAFLIELHRQLEGYRSSMNDLVLADKLFQQARQARQDNDVEMLRAAVEQLVGLLPIAEQQSLSGYGGTTMR